MDYIKHYNALNTRAKTRVLTTYTEVHHVIPRCMGGTDDATNLVRLTPEEHYVAHQLLVKIFPNVSGLAFACVKMSGNPHGHRRNKLYGWLRRKHAEDARITSTGNTHALGRKQTEEEKLRRSASLKKYYEQNPRSAAHIQKNKESFLKSEWNTRIRKENAAERKIEKDMAKAAKPKKTRVAWNKGLTKEDNPNLKGNTTPNSPDAYIKMWHTRRSVPHN